MPKVLTRSGKVGTVLIRSPVNRVDRIVLEISLAPLFRITLQKRLNDPKPREFCLLIQPNELPIEVLESRLRGAARQSNSAELVVRTSGGILPTVSVLVRERHDVTPEDALNRVEELVSALLDPSEGAQAK
jgi:hypothetical protein